MRHADGVDGLNAALANGDNVVLTESVTATESLDTTKNGGQGIAAVLMENGGTIKNLIVTDSVLYGWTSYDGLASAQFTGCTFGLGNSNYLGYLIAHRGMNTFTNCTYNGVAVTAENVAELLTYPIAEDSDVLNLQGCTVVVDGVTVDVNSYK